MNDAPRYSADEFERESRYIENLIWDALVIESGSRVLFCGYGEDGRWPKRALEAGAKVTVIEHREPEIHRFRNLGGKLLRGSTSVIPAKTDSFDLAIAFHYLHETDPFFHAQIFSELARVAKRVAVVEPGPPADRLGRQIARLYSQAKRELGQFEYYQPMDYWKRLLQGVKASVLTHVFAFAKIPPQEYLRDTIELLLETMRVEDAPEEELRQLREIARRSDTLLLPPARFVLVGAAAGEVPQPVFTPREEPTPTPVLARRTVTPEAGYEFPPLEAPAPAAVRPAPLAPAPASPVLARPPVEPVPPAPPAAPGWNPFGTPDAPGTAEAPPSAPAEPGMPFGAPFAVPGGDEPPADGFGMPAMPGPPSNAFGVPGWQWEPPEEEK